MPTPNKLGRITSLVAWRLIAKRSLIGRGACRPLLASANRRMQFSTTITAPSTISPKSSAPKLIRFADTPARTMPVMVISMARGITAAVMSAALRLPSSRNSTTITSSAPSSRFLRTVAIAFSTRLVRSYTVSSRTPSGSDGRMSSSALDTRCATAREFSPTSMNAVPSTVSRPSRVAAPVRSCRPRPTSATSCTRTGMPLRWATITSSISAKLRNCAGDRISSCWPLSST